MKLLKKENCQFIEGQFEWKKAIEISVKPLLDKKNISKEWLTEIYNKTQELGPYYIITENMAFPHISPCEIIKELSTSFSIFKEGVKFIRNDGSITNVKYILPLAAPNGDDHMGLLKEMITLWNNKDFLKELESVSNQLDLDKLIDKY